MTLATSGLLGHDSSASAVLQRSLENRLMTRLDTAGSTLFKLTWKGRTTPLGRRYLERAASVRRTSGSGCTSVPISQVPTPEATNRERSEKTLAITAKQRLERCGQTTTPLYLAEVAKLSAVPTPQKHDERTRGNTEADNHYYPHDLLNVAELATETYNAAGNNDYSRKMVELASVCSPTAQDCSRGGKPARPWDTGVPLTQQVALATVATPSSEDSQCAGAHRGTPDTLHSQTNLCSVASPSARDWKDTSGMSETGVDPDGSIRSRLDQLPRQAQLADSGATATGGTPATKSTGQLNPEYSRWLMGLPSEFSSCVDMVTLLSRRSRKPS